MGPDPARLSTFEVTDTDQGDEHATVETSEGTFRLHEVSGDWKLSNADPAIPARLVPR